MPRTRILLASLAVALAVGGVALADATFSDATGDHNEAPDLTTIELSETPEGLLTLRATVANYTALSPEAFFNLWFDLDRNTRTGEDGDEANIVYEANGVLDFYRWNGRDMARTAATGITASFSEGVLTLSLPKAALDNPAAFDILVVSSRPQGEDEDIIAADFASEQSRIAYVSPGPLTHTDPMGDEDAAPDITAVDVSDTKDGWIRIRGRVANFQALPKDRAVLIGIDRDRNGSTGDDGLDVFLTWTGGQQRVLMERWNAADEEWMEDAAPTRALGDSVNGTFTIAVHRSELADVGRFRFWLAAADFTGPDESVFEQEDELEAVDGAPESGFWQYALVNKPPVHLVAGVVTGKPGQPVHGRRFIIRAPIRRSDTLARIGAGKVTCVVRDRHAGSARRLPAVGRFRGGLAECALLVPAGAKGDVLSGQMTVRALNATGVAKFTFGVR